MGWVQVPLRQQPQELMKRELRTWTDIQSIKDTVLVVHSIWIKFGTEAKAGIPAAAVAISTHRLFIQWPNQRPGSQNGLLHSSNQKHVKTLWHINYYDIIILYIYMTLRYTEIHWDILRLLKWNKVKWNKMNACRWNLLYEQYFGLCCICSEHTAAPKAVAVFHRLFIVTPRHIHKMSQMSNNKYVHLTSFRANARVTHSNTWFQHPTVIRRCICWKAYRKTRDSATLRCLPYQGLQSLCLHYAPRTYSVITPHWRSSWLWQDISNWNPIHQS